MQVFQLALLFVTAVAAQSSTGSAVLPQGTSPLTSCDNGGSEQACRCDDGNCYLIGADVDCNLPVGQQVNCSSYFNVPSTDSV